MGSLPYVIAGAALCLWLLPRIASCYRSRRRGRHLPGPPGLPVVGNVRDIPAPHEYPWLKYHEWCREYDTDIIGLSALGSNIVLLDTIEAANELLDKRSTLYSDRPRMVMLNELAGFGWGFGFMGYGDDWRACRRMTHHEFHATPVKKYRPVLTRNALDLVSRLTKEGVARVPVHLKQMSGANIMEATYGIKVLPEDDPFIELAEAGQQAMSKCAIGFYLVEIFPLLRHIPAWFPGAGFQRQAAVWHQAATRQLHVPYADYMRREELGKADECMAKALAEAYGTDGEALRHEKMATATMYMGGVETVAAVMHTFFLTMLLYPEVQARARREIEEVVGPDRLPTFDDRDAVPYIDALIREVLRWAPIVRLDLPRRLREADVYKGYYLDKDSIVFVNIWSILHDDKMYPNPGAFTPERFLRDGKLNTDEILDPLDVAFGFGRRMCPGRYMAYETLWIAIATLLSCAEICLAKDSYGKEIEVKEDFASGFVTEPRPFPCTVRSRSDAHAALLEQSG